jgi:hypothetical protein
MIGRRGFSKLLLVVGSERTGAEILFVVLAIGVWDMATLPPYQSNITAEFYSRRAAGARSMLLVAPNGSRKRIIAAAIVRPAVAPGSVSWSSRAGVKSSSIPLASFAKTVSIRARAKSAPSAGAIDLLAQPR